MGLVDCFRITLIQQTAMVDTGSTVAPLKDLGVSSCLGIGMESPAGPLPGPSHNNGTSLSLTILKRESRFELLVWHPSW